MAVSKGFLVFVTEQLEQVTTVSSRKMFGGVGLYADDVFIGIIDDDELYFKVDDSNRPKFEERGMEPFRPYDDDRSMSYYQVPADVLEDSDQLGEWVRDAIAVARAAKRPRKGSKKK